MVTEGGDRTTHAQCNCGSRKSRYHRACHARGSISTTEPELPNGCARFVWRLQTGRSPRPNSDSDGRNEKSSAADLHERRDSHFKHGFPQTLGRTLLPLGCARGDPSSHAPNTLRSSLSIHWGSKDCRHPRRIKTMGSWHWRLGLSASNPLGSLWPVPW